MTFPTKWQVERVKSDYSVQKMNRVQYQRFVVETGQRQGNQINLNQSQDHYLRRVLRLNSGDRAIAMTGEGTAWIVELTPHQANIITPIEINTELPVSLTLLVSLPKQGIDEIIRCCTEMGVTSIVPILSARTLLNPSANKLTRWQRIAQEAAEQSERARVPTIQPPIPFSSVLQTYTNTPTHCYFCTARHNNAPLLSQVLSHDIVFGDAIVIATGCEGGWTDSEILQAQEAKFQVVSLGRRILRAVTAAIVATSLVTSIAETMNN